MVAATRRPAEELHGLVDDMIKLLESKALPDLRRGRYPDRALGGRIAAGAAGRRGRLRRLTRVGGDRPSTGGESIGNGSISSSHPWVGVKSTPLASAAVSSNPLSTSTDSS